MKLWIALVAALCLGGLLVSPSMGQTEADFAKAYKTYGTPSKEHMYLRPLIGQWKVTGKFYMKPGEEPTTSIGTSSRRWMLDKRFMMEQYKGDFMGKSFQGIGMTGFDRVKKKFANTWMDSMSTAMMPSEGTYDPEKKTFTYRSVSFDPYAGKKWKSRDVLQVISPRKHVFRMYRRALDGGPEFKMMELVYERTFPSASKDRKKKK